jgi:hypothetical protein
MPPLLPHADIYDKQRNSTMSGKKKSLPAPSPVSDALIDFPESSQHPFLTSLIFTIDTKLNNLYR